DLARWLEAERAAVGDDDLLLWKGELRSSAGAPLLAGVISNRVDVRAAAAAAERAVERRAEPLLALFRPAEDWAAAAGLLAGAGLEWSRSPCRPGVICRRGSWARTGFPGWRSQSRSHEPNCLPPGSPGPRSGGWPTASWATRSTAIPCGTGSFRRTPLSHASG